MQKSVAEHPEQPPAKKVRVDDASAAAASSSGVFEIASHSTPKVDLTDKSATGIGLRAPTLVSDASAFARAAKSLGSLDVNDEYDDETKSKLTSLQAFAKCQPQPRMTTTTTNDGDDDDDKRRGLTSQSDTNNDVGSEPGIALPSTHARAEQEVHQQGSLRASASGDLVGSFRNREGDRVFVTRLPYDLGKGFLGAVDSGKGSALAPAASVSSRPGVDDEESERALKVRSLQFRKKDQMAIIGNLKETIRDTWKKLNDAEAQFMALSMEEAALMDEELAPLVEETINDADTVAMSEPSAPAITDPFMIDEVGEPAKPGSV